LKTPPRVMQVHTFYRGYLEDFYKKNSRLAQASFDTQMLGLIRDAFSGIHMLPPYLSGCKGMLVVANCHEAQWRWLQENGVALQDVNDWQDEIVRRQIQLFQPDVLYLSDSIRFQASFIASLPWRPPCVVGWRGADVDFDTDWTGYDIMLSGLPRLLALAESLGAKKGILFHPGMPKWIAREVENIPQEIDVVFAGSIYPKQHLRRLALLEALAEAAVAHAFSLVLHILCDDALIPPVLRPFVRPPVFGMEMHRALRRGKIVFDTQGTIGLRRADGSYAFDLAAGDTVNMRLFEATGGGSMVLTDALPGLAKLFEPAREVVTFHDERDLIEKILHYLKNPQEREAIAAAGKNRCLEQWSMKHCSKHFFNIVNKIFEGKSIAES